MDKQKKKINWRELFRTYKFLLIIPIFLLFIFYRPSEGSFLHNLLDKFKFLLGVCIWASLGILVGGLLLVLFKNKGQLILDNTPEFLEFCKKSNGLVFFGPIGSGKTAILAMLANELPGENKYATFPCQLPWAEKGQLDFSYAPSQRLGVTETIFLDEINLLFKGNIVQDVRERQRFLMHFIALSRHQGTRLFVNAQRLGQVSIEQREVTTGICQVSLLQKTDEGIYIQCVIWEAAAWTNSKTEQGFVVFVPKKYLDTYNSYWLKSLKYLRPKQNYI
ncbi:MAG: ATPase [Mycoplasmataceae bacterium RV_VA103A]|nr:MAG: ATPase [Mycoplasmataceae bacterium RV_VA103A]